MAEFCLECWNKINGTNDPESKFNMSDDLRFCEECREIKKVIICYRGKMDARNRLYLFLSLLEDILISLKYFFKNLKSRFKPRKKS